MSKPYCEAEKDRFDDLTPSMKSNWIEESETVSMEVSFVHNNGSVSRTFLSARQTYTCYFPKTIGSGLNIKNKIPRFQIQTKRWGDVPFYCY